MKAREITVSARTVEEARLDAIVQLGESPEYIQVEVLEEGKPGFFGIGARPARVRAHVLPERHVYVGALLDDVLKAAGVDGQVDVKQNGQRIEIDIQGDVAWLAGMRGEAMEALQYLMNVAASRAVERGEIIGEDRIVLDIAGQRRLRYEELKKMALLVAEKVRRTGSAAKLEPMPASERRIVHMTLQKDPELRTRSQGQEPRRQVVIERRPLEEPVVTLGQEE